MKRKVYIIKGLSKTKEELQTDEYYCNSYTEFFHKNAGGAYELEDIHYLSEPTSDNLNKSLREEELDYGIIVFIGHGATKDNKQLFQLNDNEIIQAGQFTLNSPKQIVIVESCRTQIGKILVVDLKDYVPKFKNGGVVRHPLKRDIAKDVYDCHIRRCKDGIIVCFACSDGYSAYNYYFSKLLLTNAINWYLETDRHCAMLPIDEVFGLTFFHTMQVSKDKIGVEQRPSRLNSFDFPFAVSRF